MRINRFASAFWPKLSIVQMEIDRETLLPHQDWVQFFIFFPFSEGLSSLQVTKQPIQIGLNKQTEKTLWLIQMNIPVSGL